MFKEKVNKYQEETKEFINKWEEKSRDFIHNFLDHFGNSTNMIKEQVQKAMSPRPTRKSSINNGASTSSSNSSIRNPLSFSLLRNLNRRKPRNSQTNISKVNDSLNGNGKRTSNDEILPTKRTRSSYSTSDSMRKEETSSDEDQIDEKTFEARTILSAKKQKKNVKNFDDLEDVDDDLDNQIPLI